MPMPRPTPRPTFVTLSSLLLGSPVVGPLTGVDDVEDEGLKIDDIEAEGLGRLAGGEATEDIVVATTVALADEDEMELNASTIRMAALLKLILTLSKFRSSKCSSTGVVDPDAGFAAQLSDS